MANFIVIVDPDIERRNQFVATVMPKLSPVDGLVTQSRSAWDFTAVWSAHKSSPVSVDADEKGAAILWGQPIGENASDRIDAKKLRALWSKPVDRQNTVLNGFHAGVVYRRDRGLIVGADMLGIFPVYYWSSGDILLVGSSPELFRYYRDFRIKIEPAGVVGILLMMHMFGGRTLLKGVRRLDAGHQLLWRLGKAAREVAQYKLAGSMKYFSLGFSEHVDILDHAVEQTIARHVPVNGDYSLMLSGGLDSRLLAGYIKEGNVKPTALTIGVPGDIEARCAKPVARKLGLAHQRIDVNYDSYVRCGELGSNWEHVSNGFNFIMNWALPGYLNNFGSHVLLGHCFDAVIGSRYMTWPYEDRTGDTNFESFFGKLNSWGVRSSILRKLLRRDVFGDLIDQTIGRMRSVYESYSDMESQRAWCFNLYHRQRFHVGSAAWAYSFGAWPVLLVLERRLLETAAAMPAATIAQRRAEIELICRRFPGLASLPLDRNSCNSEPLRPRLRYQFSRYICNHLKIPGRAKTGSAEHRYYYRIYDFNNPGWRAVRSQAEPYRERLYDLFNKKVLNDLLPGPDEQVNFQDSIVDASGLKSLLGLMLWTRDHL
ncbi:asparagine synthase-related protein [Planctomycetota bacterium]